jgi:hypothetical protein
MVASRYAGTRFAGQWHLELDNIIFAIILYAVSLLSTSLWLSASQRSCTDRIAFASSCLFHGVQPPFTVL